MTIEKLNHSLGSVSFMPQAIHVTAGNHAAPKSQRGLDQYETPPCAIEALLQVEPMPKGVWEPCCGAGNIVAALKAHGHRVVANDLVIDGDDFLLRHKAPPDVKAILTNPPFSLAANFIRHGLKLVPEVIVLERIQFLESEARAGLFDAGKLVRIHVFRNRVPRMHRADWGGRRVSPAMMLAWFVFDRDHDGSRPELDWIRC